MLLPPDVPSIFSGNHSHNTPTTTNRQKQRLHKAQSHDSLLAPLVRIARNPTGVLESIVEGFRNEPTEGPGWEAAEKESEKRILYFWLKTATTYDDWRKHASDLDRLEGNDAWKREQNSEEYNADLIEARLNQLDDARGMGDIRLYKHSHIGTKDLLERYIDSACQAITKLLELSSHTMETEHDTRRVLEQILAARQSFGRSALLLSGGGTFGMNHIGVVKALWEAQLLPRIISGSSAGSIVCSVLCTKTDAELPVVIQEFCYGELDVFEKEGQEENVLRKAARFMKHGAIFDIAHLIRVMKNLLGDLTFQEAYNRTRRILNICVSSASLYELPRLLNYVTAPNVIIWSAVAASCSVPFVFSAASLLAKDAKTGAEVPWNPSQSYWIDGSVDNDLPMTRLAELFNVNHFIVSQVNPHVVPFLKDEDTIGAETVQSRSAVTAGSGWLHTMASLAKGETLHRMHMLAELGMFPNMFMKCRSVLSQRYSGDITIFPEIPYSQFPRVLKNPTTEFMLQAMLSGERATWPKLSRIQNHCAIELALDDAVQQLRARVVFSPSQVDLRINAFSQSNPVSGSIDQKSGLRSRPKTRHRVTRSNDSSKAPPLYRKAIPPYLLPSQSTDDHKTCSEQSTTPLIATAPADLTFSKLLSVPSPPTPDIFSEAETLLSPSSAADDELDDSGLDDDAADDSLSSPSDDEHFPPYLSASSVFPSHWLSSRPLFPSASQSTTPSLGLKRPSSSPSALASHYQQLEAQSPLAELKMTPLIPNPNIHGSNDKNNGSVGVPLDSGTLTSPQAAPSTRPQSMPVEEGASSEEQRYERIFHGNSAVSAATFPGIHTRLHGGDPEAEVEAGDLSGTRGMMRRKRSLSTGLKGLLPPNGQ
ncbi:MAG: hypothetical protein Q9157_006823 [Trypethelium eluteriae]